MSQNAKIVYPYIPNSEPNIKNQMLQAVSAEGTDEFYEDVPESLREHHADLRVVAHQQRHAHEQVVEVQGVVFGQDPLIDGIGPGDGLEEEAVGRFGELGRLGEPVLGA